MIIRINELKIPALSSSSSELFTEAITRRTVSGRLVTKNLYNKWRCTVDFDAVAMSLEFQSAFYSLCIYAKNNPVTIEFVSPYDNSKKIISAKCVEMGLPSIASISNYEPSLYTKAKAVFEEV